MIKELDLKKIDKVNNLLKEFDHEITKEELEDNKFLNVLLYDDKGIIVYDYIYDRIEIEYIIVDKNYRNMGIATKLLEYVENKHKVNNITLEVRKSNEVAINFYKKNGFNEVAVRKNYYKGEDGILMMKKIGE